MMKCSYSKVGVGLRGRFRFRVGTIRRERTISAIPESGLCTLVLDLDANRIGITLYFGLRS